MSHLLKLLLHIIHQLYGLWQQHMGPTQFKFKKEKGIREPLFYTQALNQRCRDVNCDIHL